MPPEETPDPSKHKLKLSLDLRVIIGLLLIVIVAMLIIWKPWAATGGSDDRTVSVTGEATVSAEPDEYAFYPSYQFKGTDKDATLAEISKKSDAVVAALKKLGIQDSKIKTNSSGYGDYPVSSKPETDETTYSLSLTVTVGTRELAQKVQDYLITTSPTGSISPQPTFSDTKRKELENKARDEATKDARSKADQSAQNLGFKLGKVKQVSDSTGFGGIIPVGLEGTTANDSDSRKLTVQPGENDLRYTVTVVYFVR